MRSRTGDIVIYDALAAEASISVRLNDTECAWLARVIVRRLVAEYGITGDFDPEHEEHRRRVVIVPLDEEATDA